MKSDLDRLMQERNLAGLVVAIDHNYSPPLDYLAGRIQITKGLAIKKPDAQTVLVVNPMEIEEAQVSGLPCHTFSDLGWNEMLKHAEYDHTAAEIVFWGHCLKTFGIDSGKIGIYGVSDLNLILELVRLMDDTYPEYDFRGEMGETLFMEASLTKDADEIARLREVGRRTNAVVAATWDFIAAHNERDGQVVDADGEPLTIGAVKRFIRRQLLDHELEEHGMIFAMGRDAGFPHSRGQDNMVLCTGQSIVFDLFPGEMGGGYHHDMTRTWCIGHAPDTVQLAYDEVMTALDIAVEAYAPGKPTHLMQEVVQDYLEQQGHPTARSHPGTMEGYVHGLGHGLGLQVHEAPKINHTSHEDTFQAGNVITIEPGLYYPEKGYGVRVEDTFIITEAGQLESITDFRKDLVLPLRDV